MQSYLHFTYFLYGLNVMFYGMMAWLFWRKDAERLSRIASVLMALIGIESIKDLFYLPSELYMEPVHWQIMTAVDMVVEPLYAFILVELISPGLLTLKRMILHELPFVALPLLLIATRNSIFYYTEIVWASVYGTAVFVYILYSIPGYHRKLRERFSYVENINLRWLRNITYTFFLILGLWIFDSSDMDINLECLYMGGSLVLWMFICYFIYRHESVIDELQPVEEVAESEEAPQSEIADIATVVQRLFVDDRIFLNPKLKLSDVARQVGTNRTYLSQYFNRTAGTTFFDYVNSMRIAYAENLLLTTTDTLSVVAERSGFNSLSTFRRAFTQRHDGQSPVEFRTAARRRGV